MCPLIRALIRDDAAYDLVTDYLEASPPDWRGAWKCWRALRRAAGRKR